MQNRQQVITRTSDILVYWWHMASLGHNELITTPIFHQLWTHYSLLIIQLVLDELVRPQMINVSHFLGGGDYSVSRSIMLSTVINHVGAQLFPCVNHIMFCLQEKYLEVLCWYKL